MSDVYGVSLIRTHLDWLDPNLRAANELDWETLRNLDGLDGALPAFAGRYFLGAATQTEADAGTAFCLWAHGEGAAIPGAPTKIVPIARGDRARLETPGELGRTRAREDAQAFLDSIARCIDMGEIEIPRSGGLSDHAKHVLVFLEIPDETALSVDYWSEWANQVHAYLVPDPKQGASQPYLPAILCDYRFDVDEEKFLPDAGVRACLDLTGAGGRQTRCHGFWARRAEAPAAGALAFDWPNVEDYGQPRELLGVGALDYRKRVPVRYLRFEVAARSPDEVAALALATLDWRSSNLLYDATNHTLTAWPWSAGTADPSEFGVDAGQNLAGATACLGAHQVNVNHLSDRPTGRAVALAGGCTLVFRYYGSQVAQRRNLTRAEAEVLRDAGFILHAFFQPNTLGDTASLIAPFNQFRGRDHGLTAFRFAAETIRQPPYNPIYFAVDFPIHADYRGVMTPDLATILRYFEDVRKGFCDYMAQHPGTAPYYVGVYAGQCFETGVETNACDEFYRRGLASHFMQTPWPLLPTANNPGLPFAHLNAWQVQMFNSPNAAADNPDLQACVPGGVDIDVAWGDAGGWRPP